MSQEILRTACSRDCPDACGILATVADGKVVELKGDPDHPVTKGFLCFRTSRYLDLMYSDLRITQPMLRKNGELVPCTWDEALGVVAGKLQQVKAESGPAAIFHYRSGGSLGILKHLTDLFFDQFGPCTGKVGDICSGAGEAAQLADFGVSDSNDLFDLLHSRHIVLWGKNPMVSNVHLVPVLKQAAAAGASLTLIDPIHHKSASLADLVLQPRPGGDYELAMGLVKVLVDGGRIDPRARQRCDHLDEFLALAGAHSVAGWAERADVPEASLRQLAARLADGPTSILVGWGMQRRQRGGAIVRALDALSAITGNLFVRGGGVSFYFQRRKPFRPFGPRVQHPRVIREPLLGHDLLAAQDPPVRVVWVTAGNPLAMLPDSDTVARAFEQTEFVVVADCFWTDTVRRADVVLPVPTMLEDSDLLGSYGHHWIAESRHVVPMPPGVRHEVQIFQELARRLGLLDYPQDSIDNCKRQALSPVAGQAASLEVLRKQGPVRSPMADEVLFGAGRVPTGNGRVQLLHEAPAEPEVAAPAALPGASEPLWLFTNSTEKSQASVWSGKGLGERPWVTVHPAAVPGLQAGQTVVVRSVQGELVAELRLDPQQRPDVAIVPKGGHYDRGHSANRLVAARATDLGLGAAYLDTLVRIAPHAD
jgi:anaerobic selenocysteine-containing dehydrogenase